MSLSFLSELGDAGEMAARVATQISPLAELLVLDIALVLNQTFFLIK